ncbi:MAG: hypothetical protein ABIK28_03125 [Planctomycetota bacterium]
MKTSKPILDIKSGWMTLKQQITYAFFCALETIEGNPWIAYGFVDMGADEFHPHFYCTGDFRPEGEIQGKFVGLPGTGSVDPVAYQLRLP